jgi:hypothetical protein
MDHVVIGGDAGVCMNSSRNPLRDGRRDMDRVVDYGIIVSGPVREQRVLGDVMYHVAVHRSRISARDDGGIR